MKGAPKGSAHLRRAKSALIPWRGRRKSQRRIPIPGSVQSHLRPAPMASATADQWMTLQKWTRSIPASALNQRLPLEQARRGQQAWKSALLLRTRKGSVPEKRRDPDLRAARARESGPKNRPPAPTAWERVFPSLTPFPNLTRFPHPVRFLFPAPPVRLFPRAPARNPVRTGHKAQEARVLRVPALPSTKSNRWSHSVQPLIRAARSSNPGWTGLAQQAESAAPVPPQPIHAPPSRAARREPLIPMARMNRSELHPTKWEPPPPGETLRPAPTAAPQVRRIPSLWEMRRSAGLQRSYRREPVTRLPEDEQETLRSEHRTTTQVERRRGLPEPAL